MANVAHVHAHKTIQLWHFKSKQVIMYEHWYVGSGKAYTLEIVKLIFLQQLLNELTVFNKWSRKRIQETNHKQIFVNIQNYVYGVELSLSVFCVLLKQ